MENWSKQHQQSRQQGNVELRLLAKEIPSLLKGMKVKNTLLA